MEGLNEHLIEEIEKVVSKYTRRYISNVILLNIKLDTCDIDGLMIDQELAIIVKYNAIKANRILLLKELSTDWLILIYKRIKYLFLYKESSVELYSTKPEIYDPLLKKMVRLVTSQDIEKLVEYKMKKKPIVTKKYVKK